MHHTKAVITDYIGTLTNVRRYTMEASMAKLHQAIFDAGFKVKKVDFLAAYKIAHEKYRLVRYGELREVTNAVWVSEALCSVGFQVNQDDQRMRSALEVFFQDYIDSLELRAGAKELLRLIKQSYKLGLVSNFTYAPVVYNSLRQLGISEFFDAVVVSGDNGWRKPHNKIFRDALSRLGVDAKDAVFIGDCPLEDIKGAINMGMKTVFVSSQFYHLSDLEASGQKPDYAAQDLEQIYKNFIDLKSK